MRSPVAFDGLIPQIGEIYPDAQTGELMVSAAFAVTNKVMGVFDILAYNGVEAFFFRHSPAEISDFTAEYLWPDMDVDTYFASLLCSLRSTRRIILLRQGAMCWIGRRV